ncbi:MAG: alpha/beta hydrolase [Dermatophilaceae bacterium]
MTALPQTAPFDLAAPWGGSSQIVDLDGPVHWVDFGGPTGAPPLVLVHGLGGSHLNWVQVASQLAEGRRVTAIDLAGFGLTPGSPRDTSVGANAELVGRFVREVIGEPAVLVGNSMGGLVSLLVTSRSPDLVAGLILVDPALPSANGRLDPFVALQFGAYATPGVGELFYDRFKSKYTPEQRVRGMVDLCFADPKRADPAGFGAGARLTRYLDTQDGVTASFLRAARSLMRVVGKPKTYAHSIHAIDKPVLLIHGDRDRLVPIAAARKAAADNPSWETAWLDGVGHTPQLEDPVRFLAAVRPWLNRLPA